MTGTSTPSGPGTPAPNPRLRAENDSASGSAVCALIGDLDLHTRAIAESALDHALSGRPPVLCVDMRDVHFCDSTGLNLLLSYRDRSAADGTALALVAPSPRMTRLLEVTDAETLFPIFPDCDSAVAGLRQQV